MPDFQPFNYAGLEPQGKPGLRDLVDNLMKGYQTGQMPGQMKRQAEGEQLANALKRMQVEQFPEEQRLAQGLKEAQTKELERKANNPYGGDYNLQGPARQAFDLDLLGKQYGKESDTYKLAEKLMGSSLNKGFGSAPIKMQANVIDNLQKDNPGFNEQEAREAADRVLSGDMEMPDGRPINVGGLSKSALNNYMKYGSDAGTRSALISGEQAEAESAVMVPYVQEGIAPYGSTYFGKSPALTADVAKAKAGDKSAQKRIGKFIAARTLQLENYQLQQRMQTGKVTVAATKELIERGAATIGGDFNTLTPESQRIAIDTVQEAVKKAFEERKKVGVGAWEALNRKGSKQESSIISSEDFFKTLGKKK
jgi:hypothetical protein